MLTIIFLLLALLCGIENVHAAFLFNETLDEKYQRFKERQIIVNSEIEFIEEKLDELNFLIKRTPCIKHYKILHEQNKLLQKQDDLSEERFRLTLKLGKLAEGKLKLIYRTHIAQEYEEKEYKEKRLKAREYLEKIQFLNEGIGDDDEIMKNYLIFVVACRTFESILHSDIAAVLRNDFGWKKKDFSWAKDAIQLIDLKLVRGIKELLKKGPYNYKKELYDNIKNAVINGASSLESIPMVCKVFEGVHNIVLPNKRKNIISRMLFHIQEWFGKT